METFLQKTADYILAHYPADLENVCIVLPNRRASLYLKNFISGKLKKNIFSPQIFAIEDFIALVADKAIADNTALLFELYSIHCELEKEDKRSFDEFISMGEMMLHDFNEIDLYLADAHELFSYLSELKAISLWNLDGKDLTAFQKKYLKFYQSLFTYYQKLNEHLQTRNQAYQGNLYRYVAENLSTVFTDNKWKQLVFAGFNALTKSEETIIKYLTKEGIAKCLWDADAYYVNNKQQEAGHFLREYAELWLNAGFEWTDNNLKTDVKEINIIGIPMKIGQVKYAGSILKQLYNEKGNLEHTALVLNDENLLIPALHSIPEEAKAFNVTMGLPFKHAVLFNLIDSILLMHENRIRLSNPEKKKNGFYFKDIIKVLSHPYLLSEYNFDAIVKSITTSNRIFYDSSELIKWIENLITADDYMIANIFLIWENPKDAIAHLKGLTERLHSHFKAEENRILEDEYLYHFAKLMFQLENLPELQQSFITVKTFRRIFSKLASLTSIPFYGEPLEGLQVMGMLETRTLDFENVVMLSVNEGVLPASRSFNSFIPLDIKRQFGLPDYADKDAIFAYHFYRLLQRAKKIFILYNTEADEFSGGDKSRFIYQIVNELPKYNHNIIFKEQLLNITASESLQNKPIRINKHANIQQRLNEMAMKGFSASALNTYVNCSLQFYFRYVAGLDEVEETEETIAANTLGSTIHDTLAELYQPFIGKIIHEADIIAMLPKVEALTTKYFKERYKDGDISFGINLLTAKMANVFIENYLKAEAAHIAKLEKENTFLSISMLEQKLECILDCFINDKVPFVKLKGFVDRIDSTAVSVRIIDYKTGNTDQKELNLTEPDLLLTDSKFGKSLQLLIYALLFSKEHPENDKVLQTGIISLRNQAKGYMNMNYKGNDNLSLHDLNEFEKILTDLFHEIYNVSIPFEQTEKVENCEYCAYKEICGR
ncbi:MAG: PD-(D/E)XK nuclease family protein [Bacteroidetes bacterium]|nr:PD-(D/E)XK nuclease family protein [Bacteroidota bacterium]